jgi:peptide/nickel transport system substrate-binding protein
MRSAVPDRRARIALGGLVLLFLVARAPAQPGSEGRIGVPALPRAVIDPATALEGTVPLIARQVFETLVVYREGSTDVAPGLATRWTVSRDGLVWSFTIREDAAFHDGTPLTAREIVQSFERQLLPTSVAHPDPVVWSSLLRGVPGVVKSVSAPNPSTFQITLVQPYAPLITVLAHPGFGVVRVVTGADGTFELVGTGPFRVAERGQSRLVLDAVAAAEGHRVNRLVFSEIPSEEQAQTGLAAGTLDVWFTDGPPRQQTHALSVPGIRVGLLALQTEREPFGRKKIRHAVAAVLDPSAIGASLERAALPLLSFLPLGVWGRRDLPPILGGNREAARALLAEGGWPRGLTPTLLVPELSGGVSAVRLGASLASGFGAVKVPIVTRIEPVERVRALTQAGDYDLAVVEAVVAGGDPHFLLYPLSTSEGAVRGPRALNVSFYRNERLDDLLIRASQVAFRPERARLYARAQGILADELPWIPLYVRVHWAVTRATVGGLRLHPTGFHRLDALTVEPSWTAPPSTAPPWTVPAPSAPDSG